jgi:hypothetical protein
MTVWKSARAERSARTVLMKATSSSKKLLVRLGTALVWTRSRSTSRLEQPWESGWNGGREYQAGLEAVEPLKELWRLDLPDAVDEYEEPRLAARP